MVANRLRWALALLTLVGSAERTFAWDASASIASDSWFAKNSSSGNAADWTFDPAVANKARITWRAGPNRINANNFNVKGASERKYTEGSPLIPGRWDYDGLSEVSTAAPGSITSEGDGGTTAIVLPRGRGTSYSALWSVSVAQTGLTKGTDTWSGSMEGLDPWMIESDFLTSLGPDSTYALYMPVGIVDAYSDGLLGGFSSGWGFNVTYGTAAGVETLLQVDVVGGDASVVLASAFSASQLQILLRTDTDQLPDQGGAPGTLTTAAALEELIESSLDSSFHLMAPIYLGVLLDGIDKPATLFGDDVVGFTGVNSYAREIAAVPEASSLTLAFLGTGLTGLIYRRCARR